MQSDSTGMSIRELAPMIRSGQLSPVKLVERTLERIERLNPKTSAYITVLTKQALVDAEIAERQIQEGKYLGPLHGVPIGIKDIMYVRNVRCTAGSRILAQNVPDHDSTAVRRARDAGAIILGTNNLHEFASGVTSANPFYGTVRNPWNLDRIPGGSSGGSAAAVSSGLASASLATDTGGSIRIPAALCGVLGLKPTFGRVSTYGVIPGSWSLDHVGVIGRNSWDAAAVLQTIAGHDPAEDISSSEEVPQYIEAIEGPITGIRVAVPHNYFFDSLSTDISEAFSRFLNKLSSLGLEVYDVTINDVERIYEQWGIVRWGEAATFHQSWLETRAEDYGPDVRRMLERGLSFSAVHYINALRTWREIRTHLLLLLKSYDLIATPTTAVVAPKIGEEKVFLNGMTVESYYALTRLTLPFNATGLPALSLPVGLSSDKLPIGVQLAGRPFEESLILRVSNAYEGRYGVPLNPPL